MDTDPSYVVEVRDPSNSCRDEEIRCTTAEGVGWLIEDRTGIDAATVTADLLEDGEYEHTDEETGRELSVRVLAGAVV